MSELFYAFERKDNGRLMLFYTSQIDYQDPKYDEKIYKEGNVFFIFVRACDIKEAKDKATAMMLTSEDIINA